VKRFVLNFFTLVSLVLCATALLMSEKSIGRCDGMSWTSSPAGNDPHDCHSMFFDAEDGCLSCGYDRIIYLDASSDAYNKLYHSPGFLTYATGDMVETGGYMYDTRMTQSFEFNFVRQKPGSSDWTDFALVAPLWFVAIMAAILPASRLGFWIRHRQRKHRQEIGFCYSCGYDLRATPDKCPECGMVAPKKPIVSD
jgi:hypothetical protein